MVRRINMLKAAALSAAAFAGVARAADRATDAASAALPSATADEMRVAAPAPQRALYLQEEDKGRHPMMAALDRTGAGQMMKDIGLDISGHIEVGYTYSFDNPAGDALV